MDVMWSSVFLAGFVCKTVSRLNRNHSKSKKCIKNKKGETSKTFWGCYAYIKAHMILLLERVHISCSISSYRLKDTRARAAMACT